MTEFLKALNPIWLKYFYWPRKPLVTQTITADLPTGVMDERSRYDWKKSQLHSRVVQQASKSMASRYFSVPPKEFMFISRKFIGAYTFMTVIDSENQCPSK